MAERAGFEPAIPFENTAFRERRLQPLGHLSAFLKLLFIFGIFAIAILGRAMFAVRGGQITPYLCNFNGVVIIGKIPQKLFGIGFQRFTTFPVYNGFNIGIRFFINKIFWHYLPFNKWLSDFSLLPFFSELRNLFIIFIIVLFYEKNLFIKTFS